MGVEGVAPVAHVDGDVVATGVGRLARRQREVDRPVGKVVDDADDSTGLPSAVAITFRTVTREECRPKDRDL